MMLPLVKSLTPRLQAECAGLESGTAPILEKVTPVTAELLRWWFQQDCCDTRPVNFHDGQHAKQASEVLPKNGDRNGQDLGVAGVALLAVA
jgi:hypothetical protein